MIWMECEAFKAKAAREALCLKSAKFPKQKAAMFVFFQEGTTRFDSPVLQLCAAKLLKTEQNSLFFLELSDKLQWVWLAEEDRISLGS